MEFCIYGWGMIHAGETLIDEKRSSDSNGSVLLGLLFCPSCGVSEQDSYFQFDVIAQNERLSITLLPS